MSDRFWIPVKSALPPYYKVVDVVCLDGRQTKAWLASDGERLIWTESNADLILMVTDWAHEDYNGCVSMAEVRRKVNV